MEHLVLVVVGLAIDHLDGHPQRRLGLGRQIDRLFQEATVFLAVLDHLPQEGHRHGRRLEATGNIFPQARIARDRGAGMVHPHEAVFHGLGLADDLPIAGLDLGVVVGAVPQTPLPGCRPPRPFRLQPAAGLDKLQIAFGGNQPPEPAHRDFDARGRWQGDVLRRPGGRQGRRFRHGQRLLYGRDLANGWGGRRDRSQPQELLSRPPHHRQQLRILADEGDQSVQKNADWNREFIRHGNQSFVLRTYPRTGFGPVRSRVRSGFSDRF